MQIDEIMDGISTEHVSESVVRENGLKYAGFMAKLNRGHVPERQDSWDGNKT